MAKHGLGIQAMASNDSLSMISRRVTASKYWTVRAPQFQTSSSYSMLKMSQEHLLLRQASMSVLGHTLPVSFGLNQALSTLIVCPNSYDCQASLPK